MALFLRGNVWWMEYRTSRIHLVKSTRLKRGDREKAQAVYAAWRLGLGAKPPRPIVEQLIDSIYAEKREGHASLPLVSVWEVYEDWRTGKGRVVSKLTLQKRRSAVSSFVAWAAARRIDEIRLVSVAVARQYVATLAGKANKTVRNIVGDLVTVWEAVSQMSGGGLPNPWRAACPDDDGSSKRLEAFSPDEEARVLAAAKAVGHGWHLASVISRWTGLRYGDVANLEWSDVDFARRVIDTVPNKTRRHRVSVLVPISDALIAELSAVPADRREGLILPEHAAAYPRGLKGELSFAHVLEAVGLDDGRHTFHSWRHTFRTRLAEAGVPDEIARRLGGWTNLRMSAHYDHASHLVEMREAIAAIGGTSERPGARAPGTGQRRAPVNPSRVDYC